MKLALPSLSQAIVKNDVTLLSNRNPGSPGCHHNHKTLQLLAGSRGISDKEYVVLPEDVGGTFLVLECSVSLGRKEKESVGCMCVSKGTTKSGAGCICL